MSATVESPSPSDASVQCEFRGSKKLRVTLPPNLYQPLAEELSGTVGEDEIHGVVRAKLCRAYRVITITHRARNEQEKEAIKGAVESLLNRKLSQARKIAPKVAPIRAGKGKKQSYANDPRRARPPLVTA